MSNPRHDLEDRLQKLRANEGIIEQDIKIQKHKLELIKNDIIKFEKAINLIKKGE